MVDQFIVGLGLFIFVDRRNMYSNYSLILYDNTLVKYIRNSETQVHFGVIVVFYVLEAFSHHLIQQAKHLHFLS